MEMALRKGFVAVVGALSLATYAHAQGGVDLCEPQDTRTMVPIWEPLFTERGEFADEPPQGDGLVIFASFSIQNSEADCAGAEIDRLYSFSAQPNDPRLEGFLVNIRGNVQVVDGMCHFRGFFRNEPAIGMHQGWAETYFGAIDKFEIISTGRYCLERIPES
jgi:hypothetical protein